MPNYYASTEFRRSGPVSASQEPPLEPERSAFDLGCLGPDPLFFYRPTLPNPVRREGVAMHARSALPVLAAYGRRWRRAPPCPQDMPPVFCVIWPWTVPVTAGSTAGRPKDRHHLAMEAEFDRLLMERDGLVSLGHSYLPPMPSGEVFAAAARAYQHTSPRQLEEGYRSMRRDTALFARLSGHRLSRPANRAVGALPGLKALQGIFSPPIPTMPMQRATNISPASSRPPWRRRPNRRNAFPGGGVRRPA